jgi:hypothetical protein
MNSNKRLVLSCLIVLLIVTLVVAIRREIYLQNTSRIITLNLYIWEDKNCSIPLNEINWGNVSNGENKTYVAYITTEGNTEAILHCWIDSWKPEGIEKYINLTWNAENKTIYPYTPVEVIFKLSIDINIPTNYTQFSCYIWISAEITLFS